MAPRIALIVDNPYRDLPGLVLVAWRLCQSGATCFLVPINQRNYEIWRLAPDFVLLSYLRENNEGFTRAVMDAGMQVAVLDSEGSIFSLTAAEASLPEPVLARRSANNFSPNFEEYAVTMAKDPALRSQVTSLMAWSPSFAEYASKAGWYRPEQIVVTGTPRIDYYASPWREVARQSSMSDRKYPEPMILFNGGFPLANPAFQTIEGEVEVMVSVSYERAYVEQLQRAQQASMHGFVAAANAVARRFPDTTVIYRPHPFEKEDTYKTLLEPLPNLHLVKDGTVEGWLSRAKAMIHWGSSTAVDASVCGVPAFTLGWLPRALSVPIVDDLSVRCETPDELTGALEAVLSDRFVVPPWVKDSVERAVEEAYYKVDGCAHQRVAEAILDAIAANDSGVSIAKCRAFVSEQHSANTSARSLIGAAIRKSLGLPPTWSIRRWRNVETEIGWDRSGKRFGHQQVEALTDAIQASCETWSQNVGVQPSRTHGDYLFNFPAGRSVTVFPSQAGDSARRGNS